MCRSVEIMLWWACMEFLFVPKSLKQGFPQLAVLEEQGFDSRTTAQILAKPLKRLYPPILTELLELLVIHKSSCFYGLSASASLALVQNLNKR